MTWQQGLENGSATRFQDRAEAAEQLAHALKRWLTDLLEARLGLPHSKGCIRIPASLNTFLDHYGLLDFAYERSGRSVGLDREGRVV